MPKKAGYLKKGYKMRYSGSTWYGEPPVKKEVNTVEKLFKFAEKHKFIDATSIDKAKGEKGWVFLGNFKDYSSVFWVNVTDPKLARKIKAMLKNKARYF